MKAKRRRHDPEFKARVAIEAIKNIKTTAQIAKDFEIPPAQVTEWKKQMLAHAVESFSVGKKKKGEEESSAEKDLLHAKIGQLTIENDFLVKKSKQLGL